MTHKELMKSHLEERRKREPTIRKIKTGRYTPRIEDEKHSLWRDAAARLAGIPTESLS